MKMTQRAASGQFSQGWALLFIVCGGVLTCAGACSPADAIDTTPLPVPSTAPSETGGAGAGSDPVPTGTPIPDPTEGFIPPDTPPPPECGNGIIDENELCDDGNDVIGSGLDSWDGCGNCLAEDPGFVCPTAGSPCVFTEYCGDGRQTAPETCDDLGNTDGDGCSALCGVETGWACPVPGTPCVYTVECGDGAVEDQEVCDDLNTTSGDGCSAECNTEVGFVCGAAGERCFEACGDNLVVGRESCDDGNLVAGDGCSEACQVEPVQWDAATNSMVGWACPSTGGACALSVCGDGVMQGEPCDDGNNSDLGDGCSPGCRLEPNCTAADGSCISSCGDGLILAGDNEQCDDGNTRSGDGCSATCMEEPGFVCSTVDDGAEASVTLPIVYRDFYGIGSTAIPTEYSASGHPDFENEQFSRNTPKANVVSSSGQTLADVAVPTPGLVNVQLGAGQSGAAAFKPVFASSGVPSQLTSATTFQQWYVDTPGTNLTLIDNLQLEGAAGTFIFDTNQFYPLDNRGLADASAAAPGPEPQRPVDWLGEGCGERLPTGEWTDLTMGLERAARPKHNYSFTSEVRYWFEFSGGEQLTFRGDDDVWVFINKRLVVDLGGNHEPHGGDVCGNIWSGAETAPVCAGLAATTTDVSGAPLGLVQGKVYEAVVFQAERHTCQSNYRLTLANFARRHSECATVCGDGEVAGDEQCDDGAMNGAGYGFCTTECTPGPRCGDATVDTADGELCDNGVNLDLYAGMANACAPGCQLPGSCGDGIAQSSFAEACDNGVSLNTGAYNGCNPDCTPGPSCGDNVTNAEAGEECDDGDRRGGDGCNALCKVEVLGDAK